MVAIIGILLSLVAFKMVQDLLLAHHKLDFQWAANNRFRVLQQEINTNINSLLDLRDLLSSTRDIDEQNFTNYADNILERHANLMMLSYGSFDTESKLIGNFFYAQQMGLENTTTSLYKAHFLDSMEKINVQSEFTSGLFKPVGSSDSDKPLLFIIVPLLRDEGVMENANLRYVCWCVLDINQILESALGNLEPRGIDIVINRTNANGAETFLTHYFSRLTDSETNSRLTRLIPERPLKLKETLVVAGQTWTFEAMATKNFISAEAFLEGPLFILLTGLLFTTVFFLYLFNLKKNLLVRGKIEQALKDSEERFREVTQSVNAAIISTEEGGKIIFWNRGAQNIFGYDSNEILGKSVLKLIAKTDRRKNLQILWDIKEGQSEELAGQRISMIGRNQAGQEIPISVLFGFWNAHGKRFFSAVASDKSKEKSAKLALEKSEERLRNLFVHSPDIIMTLSKEGQINYINHSFPQITTEMVIGNNFLANLPESQAPRLKKAIKKVFKSKTVKNLIYSLPDSSWWEMRLVPMLYKGQVQEVMAITTDITENRNLQTQAMENARLASIGVIAAGVAHEINNPNNSIYFNTNILKEALSDLMPIAEEYYKENGDFSMGGLPYSTMREKMPQLLNWIIAHSLRIQKIVQNLKNYARDDKGNLNEHVHLVDVLQEALAILDNQIRRHTNEFSTDIPEELPLVKGNHQQLEQVFINVILNALQSLPDKNRGVSVALKLSDSKERIHFVVKDKGIGINPSDLDKIQEPFFTTKSDVGGTGLGLPISYSIIKKHHGNIEINSEANKGSVVHISLPICKEISKNDL